MDQDNGKQHLVTPRIIPAQNACIRVVGIGGGGSNAVSRMINSDLQGADHWVLNTDAQALLSSSAENRLQLGQRLTQGLGAGGNPSTGKKSAQESRSEIQEIMEGANLVFIAAGMGGGTGTGAAPVVSEMAREAGALTVAIVTKPFKFEGRRRAAQAEQGIKELSAHTDTLIVIPNDQLRSAEIPGGRLQDVFSTADDVLFRGVKSISDIITQPGLVNVDFADVYSVMKDTGTALLGIGRGSGRSRARQASLAAINNDLLECKKIHGAKGCIINVTGGQDMTLDDLTEASEVITNMVDPDANIIVGAVQDDSIDGEVVVTVIATGFERNTDDGPEVATHGAESQNSVMGEQDGLTSFLDEQSGAKIPHFLERRRLRSRSALSTEGTALNDGTGGSNVMDHLPHTPGRTR
ncbi:MAG: cell division protein FtsZ [Synechococcus sp. SB0678_bin_12]|uniref:Cell division protein FtsZ n=1 Tax=Synechococcus sp. SB0676_bin_10 TaxID=2604869 RepID=A0A6B1F5M2_9SYNE|nr:cell division protein FtsZ [Synechococcus sp. SB0664_bin_36]MYF35884.1 cell division protein FtsZ [Synechococcus sp. SB0678_bin_12]MYG38640.1 cell division protein FtsZ [Synechococcus sp. SB0676_bin_10]MYI87387.1 cell division protein FtsZ [Synechococcus sp. SB0672_bin_10]MYK07560.1 cell division protein FtsZ [Synechococcus sp. SB0670_bin_20]